MSPITRPVDQDPPSKLLGIWPIKSKIQRMLDHYLKSTETLHTIDMLSKIVSNLKPGTLDNNAKEEIGSHLFEAINNRNNCAKLRAIEIIEILGNGKFYCYWFREALKLAITGNSNDSVRAKAIKVFASLNPQGAIEVLAPSSPTLCYGLKDSSYDVRSTALWVLPVIAKKTKIPEDVYHILTEIIRTDKEILLRTQALKIMVRLDPKKSVPYILGALRDKSESVRKEAVIALKEIDKEAFQRGPFKVIVSENKSEDIHVFDELVRILGNKIENYLIRQEAAIVLGEIGDKRAIPYLVKALYDKSGIIQEASAEALGKMGTKAKVALPALIENSLNRSSNNITEATLALGKIGGTEVFPPLIQRLSSGPNMQQLVGCALSELAKRDVNKNLLDLLLPCDKSAPPPNYEYYSRSQ